MTARAPDGGQSLTLFASFSGQGGVEKMLLNLARGLSARGVAVHLVLARAEGAWLEHLPAGIRVTDLGCRHTFTALGRLAALLRRERPGRLLVAKDRAIKTALLARRLAGVEVTLVGRLGTNVSGALAGRGALRRRLWHAGMRWFYHRLDGVVAVSEGVRDDILAITAMDPARLRVIRNPVITPDLEERARQTPDHPWLTDKVHPVVMGMGRLTRQKDFATLISAFARVRAATPCRLLILGEGRDRDGLMAKARALGVAADVDLAGFQGNPYAYLARADLFVLSSRWEGSPNALTEAMALGVPVVATDCPSGPSELLRGGRVAPLVAVGDAAGLARAMAAVLEAPPPPEILKAAVADYTMERAAAAYLGFFDDLA